MCTVYNNPSFQLTPPTYLESHSDRLITPAPYSIPVPTTLSQSQAPYTAALSPASYPQSSTNPPPTFYPSPDSSHNSPGSPPTTTSLLELRSYPEPSLSTSTGTYPQGDTPQHNFYEYMYSSFPNYQYQNPSIYTDNSVPDTDSYPSVAPYYSHPSYHPYSYSNRAPSHSNIYTERTTASSTAHSLLQTSQSSATTIQHPADSSTDLYPSSTVMSPEASDNTNSPKYPPVLVKGGGKIRAKPVKRTEFSAADLRILEGHFAVSDFARGPRRDDIARQLNVRPRSITIWFQNRRAKLRARTQQLDLLKKAAETGVVQDIEKISDFR
ncbi:homeobox protein MOX-1-like [Bolinopsis microptera]|uniref:homeobox protein MOX-1-like n=1 Tax=Bolinopsis microptera TaxID=2820187 RepID=UPI0030797AB2